MAELKDLNIRLIARADKALYDRIDKELEGAVRAANYLPACVLNSDTAKGWSATIDGEYLNNRTVKVDFSLMVSLLRAAMFAKDCKENRERACAEFLDKFDAMQAQIEELEANQQR